MSHYRANIRDIEFTLFEVLHRQDVLGTAPFDQVDEDVVREVLREVGKLAEGDIADSLLESDRTPPVFDPATGSVTMPDSFVRSYRAWGDSEYWRLEVDEALGGTPAPPSVTWAMSELVLGANPAVKMFSAGFTFANVLHRLGTPEQQQLAQRMIDERWGATMVLTEPEAGSDVGAGRTSARDLGDGRWAISGVKRFITSATAPFYDNVIHFVLARPEGAGPGTKGLSLFVLSDHHLDPETGALGAKNGVEVTGVEHKMGLKVSTTCEMRFGGDADNPAVGTLLGGTHDGIAQMFHIIEYARMLVGTKAIATLSTGYLNALEYARERVQGADIRQMSDKTAPRVATTAHPDVRRSLMLQKSYAEGLRALMLYTATFQDTMRMAEAGERADDDVTLATAVNDLLLPVVKACGSERAWVLLGTESLQTLGGSGFLQDHPIEQYVRDAKIDSLYEGTTAIQGLDFFFRKIVRDRGRAFGYLAEQIGATASGGEGFAAERAALGKAVQDVGGIVQVLTDLAQKAQEDPDNLQVIGQHTSRLLLAAGDVVIGWLLLRQAEVAQAALASGAASAGDVDFYTGKVAAASFFAREVLPRLGAERRIVQAADNSLMAIPDAAF